MTTNSNPQADRTEVDVSTAVPSLSRAASLPQALGRDGVGEPAPARSRRRPNPNRRYRSIEWEKH